MVLCLPAHRSQIHTSNLGRALRQSITMGNMHFLDKLNAAPFNMHVSLRELRCGIGHDAGDEARGSKARYRAPCAHLHVRTSLACFAARRDPRSCCSWWWT